MSRFRPTSLLSVWVAFTTGSVVFDRLTKGWVERALAPGEVRPILDGFVSVTHARNPGAAFGLFADAAPELRAALFAAAASLAVLVTLWQLAQLGPDDRRVAVALGLVAGGALGNLADRLPGLGLGTGEVIDFLHVALWPGYDWPDFNFADVAIVFGIVGLLVDVVGRESALRGNALREGERNP